MKDNSPKHSFNSFDQLADHLASFLDSDDNDSLLNSSLEPSDSENLLDSGLQDDAVFNISVHTSCISKNIPEHRFSNHINIGQSNPIPTVDDSNFIRLITELFSTIVGKYTDDDIPLLLDDELDYSHVLTGHRAEMIVNPFFGYRPNLIKSSIDLSLVRKYFPHTQTRNKFPTRMYFDRIHNSNTNETELRLVILDIYHLLASNEHNLRLDDYSYDMVKDFKGCISFCR